MPPMRKLKLDSLLVESFDTAAAPYPARGTVQARANTGESACYCRISHNCQTYDYDVCGDTNYLDCTLACSDFASCQVIGAC
jgi:hypothetical protein